jgi:hypothetical protein
MWFSRHPKRPTPEDVAKRLLVLKYVAGYALTAPPREMLKEGFERWSALEQKQFVREGEKLRDEYWGGIRAAGLWPALSPLEREFAAATIVTMTPQQQLDAMWRVEAAQVLMWALEMIPTLPPYDTQAQEGLLKQISDKDIAGFIKSTRVLPGETIDPARDLAELWHWRSRTRQLIEEERQVDPAPSTNAEGLETFDGIVRTTAKHIRDEGRFEILDEDFAVRGKAYRDLTDEEWSEVRSITMERHFALNWLCGYAPKNRWDDTPTDT